MSDLDHWLAHGNNRDRAREYFSVHTHLDPERVAVDPFPKYHRKRRVLTVWLYLVNDKGEKILDVATGSSKTKVTIRVSAPPPWGQ